MQRFIIAFFSVVVIFSSCSAEKVNSRSKSAAKRNSSDVSSPFTQQIVDLALAGKPFFILGQPSNPDLALTQLATIPKVEATVAYTIESESIEKEIETSNGVVILEGPSGTIHLKVNKIGGKDCAAKKIFDLIGSLAGSQIDNCGPFTLTTGRTKTLAEYLSPEDQAKLINAQISLEQEVGRVLEITESASVLEGGVLKRFGPEAETFKVPNFAEFTFNKKHDTCQLTSSIEYGSFIQCPNAIEPICILIEGLDELCSDSGILYLTEHINLIPQTTESVTFLFYNSSDGSQKDPSSGTFTIETVPYPNSEFPTKGIDYIFSTPPVAPTCVVEPPVESTTTTMPSTTSTMYSPTTTMPSTTTTFFPTSTTMESGYTPTTMASTSTTFYGLAAAGVSDSGSLVGEVLVTVEKDVDFIYENYLSQFGPTKGSFILNFTPVGLNKNRHIVLDYAIDSSLKYGEEFYIRYNGTDYKGEKPRIEIDVHCDVVTVNLEVVPIFEDADGYGKEYVVLNVKDSDHVLYKLSTPTNPYLRGQRLIDVVYDTLPFATPYPVNCSDPLNHEAFTGEHAIPEIVSPDENGVFQTYPSQDLCYTFETPDYDFSDRTLILIQDKKEQNVVCGLDYTIKGEPENSVITDCEAGTIKLKFSKTGGPNVQMLRVVAHNRKRVTRLEGSFAYIQKHIYDMQKGIKDDFSPTEILLGGLNFKMYYKMVTVPSIGFKNKPIFWQSGTVSGVHTQATSQYPVTVEPANWIAPFTYRIRLSDENDLCGELYQINSVGGPVCNGNKEYIVSSKETIIINHLQSLAEGDELDRVITSGTIEIIKDENENYDASLNAKSAFEIRHTRSPFGDGNNE